MPFKGLERQHTRTGGLSLETTPAVQAPVDPTDLTRLSVHQLHKLLTKLVGAAKAPVILPPTGAASAALQHQALADQVREAMATAPLALLDEVGTMLEEAQLAATGKDSQRDVGQHRGASSPSRGAHARGHRSRGHTRSAGTGTGTGAGTGTGTGTGASTGGAGAAAGSRGDSKTGKERHGSRSSAHHQSSGGRKQAAERVKSLPADGVQGDGSKPDSELAGGDSGRRHRRRHHSREGRHAHKTTTAGSTGATPTMVEGVSEGAKAARNLSSRALRAQERSLDRRIQEALNPDREAVEAQRAARRLERRIARALRSEGYGSPLQELRARRRHRSGTEPVDGPATAQAAPPAAAPEPAIGIK